LIFKPKNKDMSEVNKLIKLAIILPCYNEEEILSYSANLLKQKISELIEKNKISHESFICFVDDGSKDKTWKLIEELSAKNHFTGIKLATNFGHQNAIYAGMMIMKDHADCIITIDADLQDDINVFEEMIDAHTNGSMIVYGVRDNRETDSFFKRFTAQSFYKLMQVMKVKSIYNHADFRFIDARVIEELVKFKEVSLFLRGIFPIIGFNSSNVYYQRKVRVAGETKYPISKMISFAWNGITSFSTAPLRFIFYVGIIMFLISIFFGIWVAIAAFTGESVKGWASSLLVNLIFSGINMICLGIIGEYIGKIYQEVKQRPRYIVDKIIIK
jgi:glycosyltransferase involved in cell wall biosynthesis